jgi:hypothetical protein
MEKDKEKFERVINLIRKSKPILTSTDDIEREVIKQISGKRHKHASLEEIIDFIFGWVYISWVRRSLITASLLMVMIFIFQQRVIMKQIIFLSDQVIINSNSNIQIPENVIEKRLLIYRLTGSKVPSNSITLSEKQLEQLLGSVKELEEKYMDLINIIEENSELKKQIEEKMKENKNKKVKL